MTPGESSLANDAVNAPAHWVELRVHGVSGTPPESILDSAFVIQVAGDDRGRFFRPADSHGKEDQPELGRVVEAFHWGRFTSGSWTQALWLLIIPFGLVNAASFTLSQPVDRTGRFWSALAGAALRIVGLAMTCLLVFAAVEVAMDLYAWQFQRAGIGGGRQWWLVAATTLPIAMVWLFYQFGRTNKMGQEPGQDQHNDTERRQGAASDEAAEAVHAAPGAASASAAPPTDSPRQRAERPTAPRQPLIDPTRLPRREELTSRLADPEFFAGDPDAPTLRRLHSAAPLHLLVALLLWPLAETGSSTAQSGRLTAFVLFALNAVVVVLLGDPNDPTSHRRWHASARWISHAVFYLGMFLLVFAALTVGFHNGMTSMSADGYLTRDGGLPGIGAVAMVLLIAMVSALLVLLPAAAGLALSTRGADRGRAVPEPSGDPAGEPAEDAFRRFAGGMTVWLLAAVGAFLCVGFAAAFTFAVQSTINKISVTTSVTVTSIFQRVAYAWGETVVELVALGVGVGVLMLIRRSAFEWAAVQAFARHALPPLGLPAEWVSRVGRAMFLARLKNFIPGAFALFAVVGMVMSIMAGLEERLQLEDKPSPNAVLRALEWSLGWTSGLSGSSAGWLVWLGTWSLSGLAASLLVLGRGALKAEKARRGLNVIWDVVAFWPRRVHPFVPPPYSQHVVAGLRRRISWHLGTLVDPTACPPERPADRLVVAAHSQGTLITVAALLWLTPAERSRVGLVTFGSQLQLQFAKAFPSAVNLQLLRWIWVAFGRRWRNLYRDTDPIAGPVLSWHHRAVQEPGFSGANFFGKGTPDFAAERTDPATGRREYGPEWRLLDPIREDEGLMQGPMARTRGHSDYPQDPSWRAAVQAVLPPERKGVE